MPAEEEEMDVIVLKLRLEENLRELDEVIQRGCTFDTGERDRLDRVGGWQIPRTARLGDLAVWYAGVPDQD
jgi:hypothetical protein